MKSIFTSKTFWVNLLTGITAVSGYLPANEYTLAASAIVNIILRVMTDKAVSIPLIKPEY